MMTMKTTSFIMCIAAAGLLCACATPMNAVQANVPLKVKKSYSVMPSQDWTELPKNLNPTKGSVLTQDGVPLGGVYLFNVEHDEAIVDKSQRIKNAPRYEVGSTQLEHIDFLKTSMNLFGYLDVTTANVKPANIDGQSGTQFNLSGKYPNGLDMKGEAVIVEFGEELNIILYAAPAIHYYDKYKAEADTIMNSMTFK